MRYWLVISLSLALVCLQSVSVLAQGIPTQKDLEPMVENALEGYNREDYQQFYMDYASVLAPAATEQAFETLYLDRYKGSYGNLESKEIILEQCSFNEWAPLLVYMASFEEADNVKISVNFMKEDGSYKISQIRFDKM